MKILITNDDGIHSPGLMALAKEFRAWGRCIIVAPEKERSTTGHSLTLHKPLRIYKYENDVYSVSGNPADCLHLGMSEILGKRPDLVISGINRGANMGQDVFYSGTVSAAREAAIMGIPSVAVSISMVTKRVQAYHRGEKVKTEYQAAAKACFKVTKEMLTYLAGSKKWEKGIKNWPQGILLNINCPNLPISKFKGYKMARQGERVYSGNIIKRKDNRGRNYYWVGGNYVGFRPTKNTDCQVVHDKFVSITPLQLDTTDHLLLDHLRGVFPE